MKIKFDCAGDCKHNGVCKYADDMKKLDDSIKAINPEGRDHVTIHVKCRYYIGDTWGVGVRNGK